ncbi:MAG TPA: class I SAM-dependent methyltransferase [Roseovarius sp.]|mgnify:CR=1 FL=1|nr:class I SAM-dependent methyltransferase [Roseovarius sp.]
MTDALLERDEYWASFYSRKSAGAALTPPSQFAAFTATEIEAESAIFDIGCGNGRDSVFFAELGFKVIALDASETAIEVAKEKADARGVSNIQFLNANVTSPRLDSAIRQLGSRSACIYARFFLHAITHEEQAQLFSALKDALLPGHRLAFEYRTTADQALEKEAPPHYRRYQNAEDVDTQLTGLGFKKIYGIEGQGFAKYKAEDAIVARCLFEKEGP